MNPERYLLVMGAERSPALLSRATAQLPAFGLQRRDFGKGFTLFAAPGLAVVEHPSLVVIGQMSDAAPVLLAQCETPDELITESWGNYLALGLGTDGTPHWVMRAPLGHLPAYRRSGKGIEIIASHPDLILAVTGEKPALAWEFVGRHLAFQHLQTTETGLAGIEELLGGESLEQGPNGAWHRRQVWSPWTWTAQNREIGDPLRARQDLRASVERAVAGLIPRDVRCLLELSGGVDSSILAAALAGHKANARAVTLVTDEREGDERLYARAVSIATGLLLDEVAVTGAVNLTRPASMRSARPGLPRTLSLADDLLAEKARAETIGAFVSGAGGDCVFCSPVSAAPAADVLRRLGISRAAWSAVDALARIHHASVWDVAKRAWRQACERTAQSQWPRTTGFLAQDALPTIAPVHPWLAEPADVLPGKRSHVRAILAALAHVEGYGRHAVTPSRFPLLSQPVVETALRIPSWLWIEHGRDRAVARTAYSGFLPASVLDRRTKGGLDSYAIAMLARNRNALQPFLLEGHVSRSGLLDRQRLEAALARQPRRGDADTYLLFPLIDTEAWVRAWLDEP
ncbi:asparagine synthase C-terminal domain-containing protein [Novosphingobium sp. FKTRR1]|uniref:asparagine synthase-related protein n=1 Tax=Novosphingobium sp. FKTRR1 TaxID=2879118 RepID=UPI001CF04EA5|nr:asparagine synthase C-terminal domain-containing protein [Novosphingobium sp. FKTRR1]